MDLSSVQQQTYLDLCDGIDSATQSGWSVPCLADPMRWDSELTPPAVCRWCPVLDLCRTYAETGAVREGIMAGQVMSEKNRQLRRRRRQERIAA